MKLLVARHGESESNRLRVISNRDSPYPLTPLGRRQAARLAGRLAGEPIERIYTSPIRRARETADIVANAVSVPIESVDALREPDCGILEGRSDAAAWAEHRHWMMAWGAGLDLDRGPADGETHDQARHRFAGFVGDIVDAHGASDAQFVLITHGALLAFGLPGLVADIDLDFILGHGVGHAELVVLESEGGRLTCKSWGDIERSSP